MFNSNTYRIIRRVLYQVRSFWPVMAALLLLTLFAIPISLLKPLPLKIIIDSGLGDEALPPFLHDVLPSGDSIRFSAIALGAALLVITIAFLDNVQMFLSWVFHTVVGEKIVLGFKSVLFNHLQRLSISYHDSKGSSDALYRLQFDTPAIRTFLFSGLFPLLVAVFNLLGMLAVLVIINWPFAVMAAAIMPALYIIMQKGSASLQAEWTTVKQQESKAMSMAHEVMGALRVVKAFGHEGMEGNRYLGKAKLAADGQVRVARTSARYYFYTGIVMAIGTAFFLYYGSMMVNEGKMSVGDLTLVIAYLTQIFSPMEKISKVVNELPSSISSLDRVFALLDQEKEVPEAIEQAPLHRASGHIIFSGVRFSYTGKRQVLHDLSFSLHPGQRLGIIGSTGSGKSTIVNLLMRFYDPLEGSIELDGIDVRNYRLADYRNQFAMVLQESVLFSSSIAENIAYGKPGATQSEIEHAAGLAGIHDTIMRLPDQYHTEVGERGMQLSGGERQRISIARAFIKDAPLLLLDEPTSSLDVGTEQLIMDTTERLMKGRTTFLITHRIDILSKCDIIIRMENGRVREVVERPDNAYLESAKTSLLNPVTI